MKNQSENRRKPIKQIMKAYENHQPTFQKYEMSNKDFLEHFDDTHFKDIAWGQKLLYFCIWEVTLPLITLFT